MAVRASLKGYRVSAQKARLVADQIRGKQVEEALTLLSLSTKRVARPIAKLVRSAVANAEEKNNRDKAGIDIDNLVVSKITVGEGPSAWRVMPRAQGRAAWIQRRSSHIEVILAEK
jgi:large subunit ribosomal protein L22